MKTQKQILATIIAAAILICALPGVTQAAKDPVQAPVMATFYVNPDGSDQNDGLSPQTPFASLEKARDEVRKINTHMTGDIVVCLMDGVWELSETLCFDERDSGTDGFFVRYEAAPGAKPVISGGSRLDTDWTVAGDVTWLRGGLTAYKTPLVRDDKLRAVYINDQRASMTRKTLTPKRAVGTYRVTAGQADWAWVSGSNSAGNVFSSSDLPANTRNPQNIELESGSTWVKAQVCAATLQDIGGGETQVNFQMPYGAIAQTLLWNCAYSPSGRNDVTNVFEWLSKAGEFYYDQAGSMLYYIPRAGEDIRTAEVVVPRLEQLIDVRGSAPMERYAENIVFDGIKFAYSDWNLVEVDGSHGNCTQQGCTILTKYSGQWHNDLYRAYDIPPAAIQINTAKNIRVLNGEISNTGYLGLHLENDVWDCDVTGNYIARTGGAGVVVGHLQHIYENDTPAHRVGNGADYTKEKFPAGTESVPKHIRITNNYLLENCYFFPGNSPITSFFTYDMQVLHNFIYKCSYSGMSIGWGWCEYDGTSSSQLPGKPTTTSRANTVSYNRVEEICSILQDAGGIYTLGQQGNEDWTDVTVMNNNYINCSRTTQQADGSRMVNGFHPDEGSAYILLDGNVVTNIIRNVYELNNWQRKHDVIVTNGFSNTDRSETTAPNCSLEQYVNADCIWPLLGYKTVLDAGPENEYVHMIGKDVIADTEYELASNVRLDAGLTLPRRGLLSAADTVWIAPAGTTVFAEGPTMTKAAGNEKGVVMPETPGTYKLYIAYADGTVSAASRNTIYLGEAKKLCSVENGAHYSVSTVRPLVLELDDDNYRFTLNGSPVKSGEKLSEAGQWTLEASPIVGDAPAVLTFDTYVSESNRLLPKTVTVKAGQTVALAENLNDPTLRLWLASGSASAFKESYSMTRASGDSASIQAPMLEGVYDLSIVDADGNLLNRSDAVVKVVRGADYVLAGAAEAGRQYVVVSNKYALTDGGGDPAGATPVAVREDRIVS
ncbi:MAG: carbohydrate-binding protein, partial [Oscillospiraceae bacterium]|nr:carbohydrate-binding protein [Oscillospiraceae bacterium]